jgi:hypothetical protein
VGHAPAADEIFGEGRLDLAREKVSDPVPQTRLLTGVGAGDRQQESK